MEIYLVDGTYELFRHFFGAPSHRNEAGQEVAAVRGVAASVLQLLEEGATHVGVATDHVIESFRNDLWPGYKTGEGVDPELWSQAWPLEGVLLALGVVVWPMVELEADDALASAAAVAGDEQDVEQVLICTPDKDLGQCVHGSRIVQVDRRKRTVIDEEGVVAKFGVAPSSIPDYLALVGDKADGFPGLAGWGAKSAAAVLARHNLLTEIAALRERHCASVEAGFERRYRFVEVDADKWDAKRDSSRRPGGSVNAPAAQSPRGGRQSPEKGFNLRGRHPQVEASKPKPGRRIGRPGTRRPIHELGSSLAQKRNDTNLVVERKGQVFVDQVLVKQSVHQVRVSFRQYEGEPLGPLRLVLDYPSITYDAAPRVEQKRVPSDVWGGRSNVRREQ